MKLDVERMKGFGPYNVDGFLVNYLYGLKDLCEKYLLPEFTVLELGSNCGVSTSLFSNYVNKVISVDMRYNKELVNLSQNKKNIQFINDTFDNFFSYNEEIFDLIYIDGSHEYSDIKIDIQNSRRFLKPGGFLSGHDHNSTCPGVIKAVDEMNLSVEIFSDSSWIVKI